MKPFICTKTLLALALTVVATANFSQAQEDQTLLTTASAGALPADIAPGTPLADVVKMVQAGVSIDTIQNYIVNSQSAFNLDADKILVLKDEGVPSSLINAMLERDKVLYAGTVAPAPAPASTVVSAPDTAPPPTEVDVNYFNNTLTPYGSWVEVEGYGRCWRPTTVIYDANWRPYCDRGHWVYTDCGWYWDSDYSWGVTFHYGRWFHHARFGWCWYPDTVWAPSWVTWRSGGEYCGWAPLPPLAVYRPGAGFFYRGAHVTIGFDFGLDAGCFTFVSSEHFCERHPRNYCAPPHQVTQIFNQTTVINNYNYNDHNRTVVNSGISVDRINTDSHHHIQAIAVSQIPNAGRHGWRGEGYDRPTQQPMPGNDSSRNSSTGNSPLRHGPAVRNDQNNTANHSSPTPFDQHNNIHTGQHNPEVAGHESRTQTHQPSVNTPTDNSQIIRPQQSRDPQSVAPPVNATIPENPAPQNNRRHDGNNQIQSQNGLHSPQQQPPTRQYNSSSPPANVVQQNNGWQNHSAGTSTANPPPQHGATQLQQHQPAMPTAPNETRSYSPPPQPTPAPTPNQSHESGGFNRGSEKDKQNH